MKNNDWAYKILQFAYFLSFFVTVFLWIALREHTVLLAAGTGTWVLLMGALVWINRRRWAVWGRSYFFTGMVSSFFSACLMLGIFGLLRYTAYRVPKQWDFSHDQVHTLSKETQEILRRRAGGENGPLKFLIFGSKEKAALIKPLVELYRFHSSSIDIQVIDPVTDPQMARLHRIPRDGVVVIQKGEATATVTQIDELNLTNGILRLYREKNPKIYFTQNHQELGLENTDKEGLSELKKYMVEANFEVAPLDLRQAGKIPEDAWAVAVVGPIQKFTDDELGELESYLKRKGKVFMALNPQIKDVAHLEPMQKFLEGHGVVFSNDFVVDGKSNINGSGGTVPLIQAYENPRSFLGPTFTGQTFFPLVSSLILSPKTLRPDLVNQVRYEKVIQTSPFPYSWAERSKSEITKGEAVFDPQQDLKGPVPLVISAEGMDEKSWKLVVVGNANFLINGYAGVGSNYALFGEAMGWLTGTDLLTSIKRTGSGVTEAPAFLLSEFHLSVIFYFSVVLGPMMLFVLAGLLYRSRYKAISL